MRYPSETHLKLNSHEISFDNDKLEFKLSQLQTGDHFHIWSYVVSCVFAKSQVSESGSLYHGIALKFTWRIDSKNAETVIKVFIP